MREIKFRAKVLNTDRWIYRQPFHVRGTWYMYNSLWGKVLIEHRTIGQYTSSKDKNGKEIYEGDILKLDLTDWCGVEKDIFAVTSDNFHGDMCYLASIVSNSKNDNIEIIGNIFENPELLEGDNQC